MPRRRMKVYLPKWVRWMLIPLFAVIWVIMTWGIWGGDEPRARDDMMGWWVATIVLAFVAVLIWLMSSGKLPAYEIEVVEDDRP